MLLEEGATIETLLRSLSGESKGPLLNDLPLIFAVNENFQTRETVLKEGDAVALMTPVSGG